MANIIDFNALEKAMRDEGDYYRIKKEDIVSFFSSLDWRRVRRDVTAAVITRYSPSHEGMLTTVIAQRTGCLPYISTYRAASSVEDLNNGFDLFWYDRDHRLRFVWGENPNNSRPI